MQHWPTDTGVRQGMTVLLMADVTRMAWRARMRGAAFSPNALLDRYIDALGADGTLLVPTYNFDLTAGEEFDARRTPPITGSLGIAALAHKGFERTYHPFHSFAVYGARADDYLRLRNISSFSVDSPFALLRQHAAKLVVWDLAFNDAFTYVHHVEELEKVPYRKWRTEEIRYIDKRGDASQVKFIRYAKRAGYINEFSSLEGALREKGALHSEVMDGHQRTIVDLASAHALIAEDIKTNKARSIQFFSWDRWARDLLRPFLRPEQRSRSYSGHVAAKAR